MLIATSDVRFVKELYPRLKPSDEVIDRYRDALGNLPPIVVARDGILVDGYHRWQANLREGVDKIACENLGDLSDAEILRESYKRNATHGHQLSTNDKRRAADHLYRSLAGDEDARITDIAALLGIAESSAKKYVASARQDEKREKQDKAWDLWLDCKTQQAIADELDIDQATVSRICKVEQRSDLHNPPASRQHFDVWSFGSDADNDTTYFGKMPEQVVENLLWLYTDPGDIVVDLFAGSGTTIEVAKRMGRRVWASDRASFAKYPHLPIHEHDATEGWPADAPKNAALVILDPPYWVQAAGRYSESGDDLGNLATSGEFLQAWGRVVSGIREHCDRMAFIVSPAQVGGLAEGQVHDLAYDMYGESVLAGFAPERRVIVTYNTQQATGQQVEAARDHRKLLKLYRDLVVMA